MSSYDGNDQENVCLNALDQYRAYLRKTADEDTIPENRHRQHSATSTDQQPEYDYFAFGDDDDDDIRFFDASSYETGGSQYPDQSTGGTLVTASARLPFVDWVMENMSGSESKGVLSDPDVVYAFGKDPVCELRKITQSGEPPYSIVQCQNASDALEQRLQATREVRVQEEETRAREQKKAKELERTRQTRASELMQQAMPRDIFKPTMQLARIADNSAAWQLDVLGDSDVYSAFYNREKFRAFVTSEDDVPMDEDDFSMAGRDLWLAKDMTLGNLVVASYREFLLCLKTREDALRIAGAHNTPWIEDDQAVPPPKDAYRYRKWLFVVGASFRDQRVEVALLEHYSYMAALAWLVLDHENDDAWEQLKSGARQHLCSVLYPTLERHFVDVKSDSVETARKLLQRVCCISDDDTHNLVSTALARDENQYVLRAWCAQVSYARFDTRRCKNEERALDSITSFSRSALCSLSNAVDKGTMSRAFTPTAGTTTPHMPSSHGGQKKEQSITDRSENKYAREIAQLPRVYKVKVSFKSEDCDPFHVYVPAMCTGDERCEEAALIRERIARCVDWKLLYACAMPTDSDATSVVFRMTNEEATHIARAFLRHSEREIHSRHRRVDPTEVVENGSVSIVDDSAYFSAIAHACKCQGIDWSIADVTGVKHSCAAEHAADMFEARGEYMVTTASSENEYNGAYNTLAYSLVDSLRQPLDHVYCPPTETAHKLCHALRSKTENVFFSTAKKTQVYQRDKRMNSAVAYVLDDASSGSKSARSALVAHILLELAKRTEAYSYARMLLAMRMMQEARTNYLQTNAADAALFRMDATKVMSLPDILGNADDNDFVRRGADLYRRALTSYESKDNVGFARTFGMEPVTTDTRFDIADVERVVDYVRKCNVFDANYVTPEAHKHEHALLLQFLLYTMNLLYSDIHNDLLTEDFEKRVAVLCAIQERSSQRCMLTRIVSDILKRDINGGRTFTYNTLRVNMLLTRARTRKNVFAACFAAMCHMCKPHSELARSVCRIAKDVYDRSSGSDINVSDSASGQREAQNVSYASSSFPVTGTRICACSKDDSKQFWTESAFDPDAPDAAINVFRNKSAGEINACVSSLSRAARAIDTIAQHNINGKVNSHLLLYISKGYYGEQELLMDVRAPKVGIAAHDNFSFTSYCSTLNRSALMCQAALARYFSKILWRAIEMSKTMRGRRMGSRLPAQLNSTRAIVTLAVTYDHKVALQYDNEDVQLAAAHTKLCSVATDCLSALVSRYGRSDDAEQSIVVNVANGVYPLDDVACTALYLDYLALVWHDFDTSVSLMHMHRSDVQNLSTSCMSGQFADMGSAKLAGHLMFLRVLHEHAGEVDLRGCAWLCPPDKAVAKFIGDTDSADYVANKRELVHRCCIPVSIANMPMTNKRSKGWYTDLWMMRFTTCPFVDVAGIIDDSRPREGQTYTVRRIPPPLSVELQNDIDTYVRT